MNSPDVVLTVHFSVIWLTPFSYLPAVPSLRWFLLIIPDYETKNKVNSFVTSVSQAWRKAKSGIWISLSHKESEVLKSACSVLFCGGHICVAVGSWIGGTYPDVELNFSFGSFTLVQFSDPHGKTAQNTFVQDGNMRQDAEGGILGRGSERLWYLSLEPKGHEGTRQFQSFRPQKTW